MLARVRGTLAWWDARRAVAVLVGLGAAFRLWQYLGNPGLWLDELAVADNVITRPLWVLLTQPLADGQVAPPGFLVVTRLAVVAFGRSEYALRLFPLLCSLASLALFARIVLRVLRGPGAVLAMGLFSLSPGIVLYGAEAKQYSSDILVALALTELVLTWLERPDRRRTAALAVTGMIAPFFSQPAVFVLAALGGVLLFSVPRGERRQLLVPLAIWVAASGLSVAYARSRMSSGLAAFMQWFWRDGFLPFPPKSVADALWPARAVADVFGNALGYPWPWAYLALAVWGVVMLARHARLWAWALGAPVLVTLAAAIAHAYPFRLRVVIFLVPALLMLVAEGAASLASRIRNRVPGVLLMLAVAAPVVAAVVRTPPVWRFDEVRPVLAELQRRRLPEDAVYVTYPTWQAIRYYGPRYGLGFDAVDVGACHPSDLHDYLHELDRYRGRRVWFLAAFATRWGERPAMRAYLEAIGVRKDTIEGPPTDRTGAITTPVPGQVRPPAGAYLYDLTDPGRLASTTADRMVITQSPAVAGPPRCVEGPVVPRVPTVGG
jgi:Dolichyl-phosphate-mannose-protein mannosyltransferase